MKRSDIINQIIKERGYKKYLEIGLGDGQHFSDIKCDLKDCVDPNSTGSQLLNNNKGFLYNEDSDDFFLKNMVSYDLIFIDGLHHADQVERDIVNSWNCLNKGGLILIHDIKPKNFEEQVVPMGNYPTWTGDVWRAWYGLKNTYPKIKSYYIEEENGLGAIEKSRHKLDLGFVDYKTNWEQYNHVEGWNSQS